ncbi:molybdate ABC transporter substrate-binding protein [Bremerella cremea]|nr:molybdate ABC transporter substrate-binding protein [Bremerella cremea]
MNLQLQSNLWCYPWLLLCGLGVILGCGKSTDAKPSAQVLILGAASTKDALQEMANVLQKSKPGELQIEISTGPSHALAQQILSGAPADIYISANRRWADKIAEAGLAEQTVDWLGNSLVLVVPTNSPITINGLEDLTSPEVKRIAVAGQNVPAGIYAEEALKHYKLWTTLSTQDLLVRGHDVRSTLTYAERGEVDAAVVYATDALLTDKVRVVARFDTASHEPIVYPLVRIKSLSPNPAADHVFKFLQSAEALQIGEKYGFVSLEKPLGDTK